MRIDHTRRALVLGIVLTLLALAGHASAQQPKSLVTTAKGEGTIKIGKETFKLYAVVVKLFEDGKAEINLITDITAFMEGTWSRDESNEKSINLKITGNMMPGSLDGGGKVALTDDRKSIAGLNAQVVNKTTRKTIKVDFVTKGEQ
jgi:hypothetical protein